MAFRRRQKILLAFLTLGLALSVTVMPSVHSASNKSLSTAIDISAPIDFKGADKPIGVINEEDVSIRKLLRRLARAADVNIVLDDSVEGSVSLSLSNVTVKQALDYLRKMTGLYYSYNGNNILMVTNKETATTKGLNKNISKILPVKYINSKLIAGLLNNTIFKDTGETKKATSEFRTNTIIIVGTDNDIRLAEDLIDRIDIPRESKVFKINHASTIEVAQLLQATIFNDGITSYGSAAAAGADGMKVEATPLTVVVETFEEGSGSEEVQGASSEGGGGSEQTFTLRSKSITQKDIDISPEGPVLIPDTRTNTLTIMGTIEQIALAEAVIPNLDQKLPQVAIEASLIEMFCDGLREKRFIYGSSDGQFATGYNNEAVGANPEAGAPAVGNVPGQLLNLIGIPTSRDKGKEGFAFNWTTVPVNRSSQFIAQINNILSAQRGKLLANPTIIAVHNTEAIISITEEVVRDTQITRDATGFTQTQVEIGEAGIILNIIPKISSDGFVSMRIRPSVSTIARTIRDAQGNIVTLLNRRDLAVQEVRVANGQTLVLGGLIQEQNTSSESSIPGISSLPIVGALFRNTYKDSKRTELVTLVTPRILEDSKPLSPVRISQFLQQSDFNSMIKK